MLTAPGSAHKMPPLSASSLPRPHEAVHVPLPSPGWTKKWRARFFLHPLHRKHSSHSRCSHCRLTLTIPAKSWACTMCVFYASRRISTAQMPSYRSHMHRGKSPSLIVTQGVQKAACTQLGMEQLQVHLLFSSILQQVSQIPRHHRSFCAKTCSTARARQSMRACMEKIASAFPLVVLIPTCIFSGRSHKVLTHLGLG